MTRLLLVRHGETDWNVERRVQGHSDTPLNEHGRAQARRLAGHLGSATADRAFDLVLSSDLSRALETARLALPPGTPIETDPDLRELDFGDWEGRTGPEIEAETPGRLGRTWRGWGEAPGGESMAAFAARVARPLARLRALPAGSTALVVAHGGTLRVLVCLAMGLGPERTWQFTLANTAVTELELSPDSPDGAVLHRLNDTAHLR